MTVRPLPQDAITSAQRGRIEIELFRLNPLLPYDNTTAEGEAPWTAELNVRCNLNLGSIDELTKREASKVISQLQKLT